MAKRIVYFLDTIVFCLSISLLVICLKQLMKDVDDPFSLNYLSKVYYNWKRSPIVEAYFYDCLNGYQTIPLATYEGNYHGCQCIDENQLFTYKVNQICTEEEKKKNCTDISEEFPKLLNYSMTLFAYYKLSSKTYYDYLETAVSKNEDCPENYHQCGILDTVGNKMCLRNEEECPINYIDWENFKTEKTNVTEPIMLSFNGTVGELCLHSSYKDKIEKIYPLSKGIDKYGCPKVYNDVSVDNRFSIVGEEDASLLYLLSGLNALSQFESTNNRDINKIKYYLVNYIGLDLVCFKENKQQFKEQIMNNDKLSQTLYYYKMSKNVEAVMLIFYGAMIFLGLVHWFITLRKYYRLMNKLENQIWTMKVLLSFFSCFIILSFYWSSPNFTIPSECFVEAFEKESLKQANESIARWKNLDLSMIIISLICGLICFGRDFLNKDDIINADYIQYIKPKEDDELDHSSFYEERNSSAASIEVDNSIQGSLKDEPSIQD